MSIKGLKVASYSPIFIYTQSTPKICQDFYTCVPPVSNINEFDTFLKAIEKCYGHENYQPTFLGYDCKGYALGIGEVGYIAMENTKVELSVTIGGIYGLKTTDVKANPLLMKTARELSLKKSSTPNVLDNEMKDICIFDFKKGGDESHTYKSPKDGDIVVYSNGQEWTHAARYYSEVCEEGMFASKLGVIHPLFCHPILDDKENVNFSNYYGDNLMGITTCDNFNVISSDL